MAKNTVTREIDIPFSSSRRTSAVPGTAGSTVNTGLTTTDVASLIDAHAALPGGSGVHHAPVTLASPSGLSLSGQQLALDDSVAGDGLLIVGKVLKVGNGDGINVLPDGVEVYATDLVSGNYGLTESTNDIVIKFESDSGLDFGGTGGLTMGTPITVGPNTTNQVTGTQHSHAADASNNPGAAEKLLKSTGAGALTLQTMTLAGSGIVLSSADADNSFLLGRAKIDSSLVADGATFSHRDHATSTNYCVGQGPVGNTHVNAGTGLAIYFKNNNTEKARIDNVDLMLTDLDLRSSDYSSRSVGWRATRTGEADFRYIFTDEMHIRKLVIDLQQAIAGWLIVARSAAELAVDFTAPAAGGTATLRVFDRKGAPNVAIFASGSIVLVSLVDVTSGLNKQVTECWGVVTSYADQTDGTQTWTFTRSTGGDAGAMATSTIVPKDSPVIDFGSSGMGWFEVNAVDGTNGANSPYTQIVQWTTHPKTGRRVMQRSGNLNGLAGFSGKWGQVIYGVDSSQYIAATQSGLELQKVQFYSDNGAATTISIQPTGDVKFGSNISAVSSTHFFHVGADQTYNSESVQSGDLLIGNHAAANLFWDRSAGQLKMRNNTTTRCYIDTSGFNAGVVRLNANGINSAVVNQVTWGLTAGLDNISVDADQVYSFSDSAVFGGLAGGKASALNRIVLYNQVTQQAKQAETIIDARFTRTSAGVDELARVVIAASRWIADLGVAHNSNIEILAGTGNVDKITMTTDRVYIDAPEGVQFSNSTSLSTGSLGSYAKKVKVYDSAGTQYWMPLYN